MLNLDIRPFPPLVSLLFGEQYDLYERCIYGFATAFIVVLIIGKSIIRMLLKHQIRQVFRTKQQVRDLAILHDHKRGVPTMGGIMIALASFIAIALWTSFNDLVITSLLVYFLCSLLGATDDILKIIKGNSKGVTSGQKLFVQALMTGFVFYIASQNPPINDLLTHVNWKWFHSYFDPQIALAVIVVFYFCVIAGTSNAVNLTDGVDGLAIINIALCFVSLAVCAFYSSSVNITRETLLSYIAGSTELAVLCSCFAGGCLAFFLFNVHPASIFMGDIGSIGLGGLLAIVASLLRLPFILLAIGIIFVIETISVMLQVTSKKIFRKRIFLMAPLHHHFELKGFFEGEIVKTAFCIQVVFTLIALFIIFYGYTGNH
ncbi:MAG: phospho-N-acetylmuramoyl-pentapeptide-transferase [Puniceicoccales bacterium]|jgi:phospho-N-acetylmuramoyl-pentapeptide-transferase|nr:phospho-N-acetylmuramoyl-pentapeptide-transferase [Puniceicoccales bacterium]